MSGVMSRAAAQKAEAEATEKKRLEAEAAAKAKADADRKAAEDEESEKKKKAEADKAEADRKAAEGKDCPKDDDENMDKAAAAALVIQSAQAQVDAPAIIELCADAGVPKLAAALVKEGLTLAQARDRIDAAGDIRQMVGLARKINPAIDPKEADNLIAAGASKAHAKTVLFDKLVSMQSPEIAARHTANGGGGNGLTPAGNYGWDKVMEKLASDFKLPQTPKH